MYNARCINCAVCRGVKGIAFTDALDNRVASPVLPDYGSPEYDATALNRFHASVPALLSATAAADVSEASAEPGAVQPKVTQTFSVPVHTCICRTALACKLHQLPMPVVAC